MPESFLDAFARLDLGASGMRGPWPATAPAMKAECPPPCPACGGLECLCRPRFFAGQLLTDEDLNRLDRYIVEKNKLHNRYLHGWGVVCGLEVSCDPCDKTSVAVKTGYAIAPCGDDIVVCDDRSVNICDLINQCRPVSDPCDSAIDSNSTRVNRDCIDGIERWVLAICYQESPSRGITPLRTDSGAACCGNCGCTGTSCQCKPGGGAAKAASAKPNRQYKPQCEPTLVCEGYRFIAYRAPIVSTPSGQDDQGRDDRTGSPFDKLRNKGPLVTRVLHCYMRLREIADAYQQRAPQQGVIAGMDVVTLYSDILDQLRQFVAEHASHRCDIMRALLCLEEEIPRLGNGNDVGDIRGSIDLSGMKVNVDAINARLSELLLILLQDCVCSALLPPCPAPEGSNCVPLAVVTVRKIDCSVLNICNWEVRKLAITLPNLYYWLSWLPWDRLLGLVQELCCKPLLRREREADMLRVEPIFEDLRELAYRVVPRSMHAMLDQWLGRIGAVKPQDENAEGQQSFAAMRADIEALQKKVQEQQEEIASIKRKK